MSDSFAPVMDVYAARVIVTYLAQAFNGTAAEVPPTRSPLWPIATRMVDLMRRDRYALGSYYSSSTLRVEPAQRASFPDPAPFRSVAVRRPASYGHAAALR